MGMREFIVDKSRIVNHSRITPHVMFRPDVSLMGNILNDDSYTIHMVEIDGVMTINISKKEEGG